MMNERILDAVQRPPLKGFSGFSFAEDGIVIGLFFIHTDSPRVCRPQAPYRHRCTACSVGRRANPHRSLGSGCIPPIQGLLLLSLNKFSLLVLQFAVNVTHCKNDG